MLAFITSLAHPDDISDLAQSDSLLAHTLESLSHQTDNEYIIIVVGDRTPEISLPPKTEFIPVNFPPRGPIGYLQDQKPSVTNKGSKLGIGLVRARELGAKYVMIFDYDDFVHRDLARFVNANPDRNGWYVPEGWRYSVRRNVIQPLRELNRVCGTCNIVPLSAYDVPQNLTVSATQAAVLEAYGEHIDTIIGRHSEVPEHLAERGIPLERFPYPAVLYNVETSLNISGSRLLGFVRPLTKRRAQEFGIEPSRSVPATLRFVWAPSAIVQGISRNIRRLTKRFRR